MERMQADIQEIVDNKELFLTLKHSTILITGATGFIGSMLVRSFLAANEKYGLEVKVIGQIRNLEKAKKIYGEMFTTIGFVMNPRVKCDYIIHTVSPTNSKYFIEYPVETIKSSVESTMEILELLKAIMLQWSIFHQWSSMEFHTVWAENDRR